MFDIWSNCKTFVHSGKNQMYVVHWIQKLRLSIYKIKTFSARNWPSKEITLTSYHMINSFPRWSKINFFGVLIERERETHTHTHLSRDFQKTVKQIHQRLSQVWGWLQVRAQQHTPAKSLDLSQLSLTAMDKPSAPP